jgi:hypothetical protein
MVESLFGCIFMAMALVVPEQFSHKWETGSIIV